MTNKRPLCKDCANYITNIRLADGAEPLAATGADCIRNDGEFDLVKGKPVHRAHDQTEERRHGWLKARLSGSCGKEGRFFRPASHVVRAEPAAAIGIPEGFTHEKPQVAGRYLWALPRAEKPGYNVRDVFVQDHDGGLVIISSEGEKFGKVSDSQPDTAWCGPLQFLKSERV